jgi:hypothetical protein
LTLMMRSLLKRWALMVNLSSKADFKKAIIKYGLAERR